MADQTIIEAARKAYTPPKPDYSGYVKMMDAVSKFIGGKKRLANEQETKLWDYEQEDFEGINSTILSEENVAYLQDLRTNMYDAIVGMQNSLPGTDIYQQHQKIYNDGLNNLQQLKKDAQVFTDYSKLVHENKNLLSQYQGPLDQSFIYSLITEPDVINNSVKFTDQGMQILGETGQMIAMGDLPKSIYMTEGSDIDDLINNSSTLIGQAISQGSYDENFKTQLHHNLMKTLKTATGNQLGSAIFDYEFMVDGKMVSYVDVMLDEDPDLKADYEAWIEGEGSGMDVFDKADFVKQLVRGKEGFDIEKYRGKFLDWVVDKVFGTAEVTGEATYKRNQRRNNLSDGGGDDKTTNRNIDYTTGKGVVSGTTDLILNDGDIYFAAGEINKLVDEPRLSEREYKLVTQYDANGDEYYELYVAKEDGSGWTLSDVNKDSEKYGESFLSIIENIEQKFGGNPTTLSDVDLATSNYEKDKLRINGNFTDQEFDKIRNYKNPEAFRMFNADGMEMVSDDMPVTPGGLAVEKHEIYFAPGAIVKLDKTGRFTNQNFAYILRPKAIKEGGVTVGWDYNEATLWYEKNGKWNKSKFGDKISGGIDKDKDIKKDHGLNIQPNEGQRGAFFEIVKRVNRIYGTSYRDKDQYVSTVKTTSGDELNYWLPTENDPIVRLGTNLTHGGLESKGFLKKYLGTVAQISGDQVGTSGLNHEIMSYGETRAIPALNAWVEDIQGYVATSTGGKAGFVFEHPTYTTGYWMALYFYDHTGKKINVAKELRNEIDFQQMTIEHHDGIWQIMLDENEGEDAYNAGLDLSMLMKVAIKKWGSPTNVDLTR